MGTVMVGALDLTNPEKFSPASKFIELVEWNPKDNTMDITFKSGSKRRHFQAYPTTFLSFKQSPNHDSFYARAIKGTLRSVPLVDQGIGRKESTPLHKQKQEKNLNAGIRHQQARTERIAGTVNRAYAGR